MSMKKIFLLIALMITSIVSSFAQKVNLSGQITSVKEGGVNFAAVVIYPSQDCRVCRFTVTSLFSVVVDGRGQSVQNIHIGVFHPPTQHHTMSACSLSSLKVYCVRFRRIHRQKHK